MFLTQKKIYNDKKSKKAKTRRIGMAVWKISEDVFYVGVNDTTLDLFKSRTGYRTG